MREIKFRAWDTLLGRIIGIKAMDKFTIRSDGLVSTSSDNDIKLMQYTGLKDTKLEKQSEVYESDIIEFINGNRAVVEFDNFSGGWIARSIHNPMMKWGLVDSLLESALVIGNVYENKELLDSKC